MLKLIIRVDMGKQDSEEIEAAPQPPRRRGRPSLGDEAMSSRERQKQYGYFCPTPENAKVPASI
jgi:hypothetical protein